MDEFIPVIERSLRRISSVLREITRHHLTQFHLTMPQFQVLTILITHGELSAGELSKKMFLNSATITGIVDRLDKDGLVIRSRSRWDRRIVIISITEKGEDLTKRVLDHEKNYMNQALVHLSIEDKKQLADSLMLLYQHLINKENSKEKGDFCF